MIQTWLGAVCIAWLLVQAVLLFVYRHALTAYWREPVLRYPVLIFESDDWGAGPLEQAHRLDALRQILKGHRDQWGHYPVMTMGIILSIADTEAMCAAKELNYIRISLDHTRFKSVLTALYAGINEGVFAPQLHGMEHYWPPVVMAAAKTDAQVATWLKTNGIPQSEALPSRLQSRWIDAASLPSQSLSEAEIGAAVVEEVSMYTQIFGTKPVIAVPTTFVWSNAVERAWANHGVSCIVTPGTRYESRDTHGRPSGDSRVILNGERGQGNVMYLVRNNYFEPKLGHRAEKGLDALALQTACGRPTLLETHRFNFLGDLAQSKVALAELDRLLTEARAHYSELRFLSTQDIAEAIASQDTTLITTTLRTKINAWLARINRMSRFWKLARLTGLIVPLWLLGKWAA
ncbi:MAG: hypothetical protein DID92_2727743941 [Candidatus Nitrotoga sp. SPKER]|nr:MAG: hypothetical protein DID92_2727743941 [Candidatus Nitrotoga sp. SPKER]